MILLMDCLSSIHSILCSGLNSFQTRPIQLGSLVSKLSSSGSIQVESLPVKFSYNSHNVLVFLHFLPNSPRFP